jgi:enoyl-CoA hydratase/carnithine racemase
MAGHIFVTDTEGIRTIRMNRPEKKNALTNAMYQAMAAALDDANANELVRCILIAGVPGAFSAGNDIADFVAADGLDSSPLRFLAALISCSKPLVAAVNGVAIGIGSTMLLHCDFVVAGTEARFAAPFVSLGLVPEGASSLLMPRLFGRRRAFEFLVMGHSLNAIEAKELGLVNRVVASEEADSEALNAAREIAALPPDAVKETRRLMNGGTDEVLAHLEREAAIFRERLHSPEAKSAFQAFFARKR